MSFEKRLQELGLELPDLPQPVANYVPGLEAQGFLFGYFGSRTTEFRWTVYSGNRGTDSHGRRGLPTRSSDWAFLLSVAKHQLGSLDRVERIVKLVAFVRCGLNCQNLLYKRRV